MPLVVMVMPVHGKLRHIVLHTENINDITYDNMT